MNKAITHDEEYSKVFSDMEEHAQALSRLFDSAYAIYSPMSEAMINSPRVPDARDAERLMDGLMNYANDPRFVELYNKLCQHIQRWYPDLVKEHVACFHENIMDDKPDSAVSLLVE